MTAANKGGTVLRWAAVAFVLIPLGVAATADNAAPPAAGEAPTAMDEPLRLLERARKGFEQVKDYTCDFIKRERIRGEMQPDQFMRMKVRTKPFYVHLRWELPRAMAGQEACYVEGRNGGRIRVKPNRGLVSLVGGVSLALNDPRVMRDSRHQIDEAGIGNLLEQFGRGWPEERRLNRTKVNVATYEYAGRRCRGVETVHPPGDTLFLFHRTVLYFDVETGVPLRVENYDRPRTAEERGELLEVYSYLNLRTNVGLGDDAFNF